MYKPHRLFGHLIFFSARVSCLKAAWSPHTFIVCPGKLISFILYTRVAQYSITYT